MRKSITKMALALVVGLLALSFRQPVYAAGGVESESNDTFDTANVITLGTTYSATLPTTADKDYYKVALTEGTEYQILISNANKISHTELYFSDKETGYDLGTHSTYDGVAEAYKCVFTAPETGNYYVYIANNGIYQKDNESYTLCVAETGGSQNTETEFNDSFETADVITLGTTYSAKVATTSDFDYYKVALKEGTEYQILISNATNISHNDLYLPDKEKCYDLKTHSNFDSVADAYKCVFTAPETGNYYIYIANNGIYQKDNQSYTLCVAETGGSQNTETEFNDSFETADVITLGTTYSAKVATTSDFDYYKVALTEGTEYQILISNATNISHNDLYLPDKDNYYDLKTHSNFDSVANAYKCVFTAPETGNYYIYIANNGIYQKDNQSYTLCVAETGGSQNTETEFNDSFETADVIALGATYSAKVATTADKDFYKIALTEGTEYQILVSNVKNISHTDLFLPDKEQSYDMKNSYTQVGSAYKYVFTAPETGNYYIYIANNGIWQKDDQDYQLRVSVAEKYQPVYRLYNPNSGEHLYTTDVNETRILSGGGWTYEGTAWSAPQTGKGVYRLYSDVTKAHLYTSDENEVRVLSSGPDWTLDNGGQPLFYTDEPGAFGTLSIYRLYNESIRMHLLTTDLNEYNVLAGQGWTQEGQKLSCLMLGDSKCPLP